MNQKVTIGCINKFDIELFFDDASARYIEEVLQNLEYKELLNHLKEKKDLIIVDIGANVGTFSFYVYDLAKKIYTIEPIWELTDTINTTIKVNRLSKMIVSTIAISNFTGRGVLNKIEPVGSGGSFLDEKGNEYVDVMTLNDFCSRQGINKIDVLKIDVEGEEQKIIDSINFDKVDIELIIGEIHVGKISKDYFLSNLEKKGYKTFKIGGDRFIAKKI